MTGPAPGKGDEGRRHIAIAALAWVAATAIGEVIVQLWVAGSLPLVASEQGDESDDAIVLLLRLVVPVLAFVIVVVVYSMIRFRVPEADETDAPVQHRDYGRFSWSFLGLTSALTVLVIVVPGVTGINAIFKARDARDPLVVGVTGSQWEWRFSYPQQRLTGLDTLVLPVGRTVRFVLTSKDVIHSFWVPAFRIKEDVVPGETRELFLTPDRTISTATSPLARVQCAELCGVGHATMRAAVRVVTPQQFAAWVARQRQMR